MIRAVAVVAAVVLLLSGCATGAAAPSTSATSAARPFVIDQDFPDPDVVNVDGTYYAFATNGPGFNIRSATSTDLTHWTVSTTDPLPKLPSWASPGKTWAPDVSEFGDGQYVMYFTAADSEHAVQCIGVATSTNPAGPFVPQGDEPLVCPADDGGAIDPATFVDDDGTRYLVFKNDGNCCGFDTWLQAVPLSGDGLSLAGDVTKLIKQDQDWEGDLVEAPTLIKRNGAYLLFYSANSYGGDDYATGYASASTVLGPYVKGAQPLLTTASTGLHGPGGQDVVTAPDGTDILVFHSWDDATIYRGMDELPLAYLNGVPSVAGN